MTDNEIIKALECCSSDDANCDDCPANKYCTNDDFCLTGAILDLIKRQQAEIERLKRYNTDVAYKHYNDGIKEFAERLKKRLDRKYTIYGREYVLRHMRELIKEMTEGV